MTNYYYIFFIVLTILIIYFIQFNLFMNKNEDWNDYNILLEGFYNNKTNNKEEYFIKCYAFLKDVLVLFYNNIEKSYNYTINYVSMLFSKFINIFYSMSGYIINKNKKEGFCFSGDNLIKLNDGSVKKLRDIHLGETIDGGSVVYATMKIKNTDNNGNYISKLYSLPKSGVNESDILVSESHLILDNMNDNYIYVKDHPCSILLPNNLEEFFCLITSDHNINIGEYIFSDWEDNGIIPELNNSSSFINNEVY